MVSDLVVTRVTLVQRFSIIQCGLAPVRPGAGKFAANCKDLVNSRHPALTKS
jgi:hypothetical protein